LWVSTNRGIASFDPRTKVFRTFLRSHGLQGDEFNFGAHFRTDNGEVVFGGANGYNFFLPERLRFNERPPAISLTGFLKFNEPAQTAQTPDSLSRASLGHRDDVITFEFAALDFTAPDQNRYAYKLVGFDDEWIDAGKVRRARRPTQTSRAVPTSSKCVHPIAMACGMKPASPLTSRSSRRHGHVGGRTCCTRQRFC
jgi:hypothetical protein